MQRRLGILFPIVLLAMLVQFLAPIGASWAFASAASDPLHLAGICSSAADAANDTGNTAPHQTAHTCCTLCCVGHAATPTPDPQSSFVTLQRDSEAIVWRDRRPEIRASVAHVYAQARAPPAFS